jgi:hypothetical protein
MPNNAFDS